MTREDKMQSIDSAMMVMLLHYAKYAENPTDFRYQQHTENKEFLRRLIWKELKED